ncbi:MAG: VWA domain-containing protein, partial [Cyclobacteriaceae bacterium]
PLLLTAETASGKSGVLLAENFWRWRLGEFADRESTAGFDELFSKLIQYLSTREEKRKFRSFAVQPEFSGAAPVQIESQVFNDLFEPIYGQTIDLVVQNENEQRTSY